MFYAFLEDFVVDKHPESCNVAFFSRVWWTIQRVRYCKFPTSAHTAKKLNDVSLHLFRKCDLHNPIVRLGPLSPFVNLGLMNYQKIIGGYSAMR